MADFGALGGINSLYGYSSQLRSLYNIERGNNTLFKALTGAAEKSGASSLFGNGALDVIAKGGFDSWNDKALQKAGADPASLNYLKEIKSGAKELKTALNAAPQAAGAGGETAADAVKNVVGGVNKLLSAVYENVGKGSERLFDDVVSAVRTYAPALDRVGVSMASDGRLKIDEAKLKGAAESGEIDKFLTKTSSSNYGFTSKLTKVARNIESNPSYYTNAGANAVNNTGYYDYQSYNRYSNVGLLLNSLA
jgi:flagellar capping protein FliD